MLIFHWSPDLKWKWMHTPQQLFCQKEMITLTPKLIFSSFILNSRLFSISVLKQIGRIGLMLQLDETCTAVVGWKKKWSQKDCCLFFNAKIFAHKICHDGVRFLPQAFSRNIPSYWCCRCKSFECLNENPDYVFSVLIGKKTMIFGKTFIYLRRWV